MLSCEVSEKGRGRSCVKVEVAVLDSLYLSPYGLCGRKATLNSNHCGSELRSCVNVEVAILNSHSLTVLMVSVDVRQHLLRAQDLCKGRGSRSGLAVPNSPYGLCGREATLNER